MNDPTDQELMLQVKDGDVRPLGELFERHHGRIYHFCRHMTGNEATSQDLVQEIFMRVLRYRGTFRSDSSFRPWLYRMARNACIDHFRRGGRELPASDELPEPTSDEPSAAERLEVGEDITRLRAALMRLPLDKREVLILSRFEFRKYSEIAELLGCSVGAVKVRVHRALKQLRAVYLELASEAAP